MDFNEAIGKAIDAHGKWFARLRTAIETGSSEFKPDIVMTDNNCEFGKWLYNEFPVELRKMPAYNEIKNLHALFHGEAGKILTLALQGKKEEALQLMGAGSQFKKLSGSLVLKLQSMQKK